MRLVKKWWGEFLLIVLVDQATKMLATTKVLNTSGVFGIGEQLPWGVVLGVVLLVVFRLFRASTVNREKTALLAIFSAGMSNFIDRLLFDGVRDFIWWPVLNVYGNVADMVLTLAVGYLAILFWQNSGGNRVQ